MMFARMMLIMFVFATLDSTVAAQESDKGKQFLSLAGGAVQHVDSQSILKEVVSVLGTLMVEYETESSQKKFEAIQKVVEPIWKALPKTLFGHIDRGYIRYIAHRYFMQTSALSIRGFEPTKAVNGSNKWGVADILSEAVPTYVQNFLETRHRMAKGYTLRDAVEMIVVVDGLIVDSQENLIHRVYMQHNKSIFETLSADEEAKILEDYMVEWIVEQDEGSDGIMARLMANSSLVESVIPHYGELMRFVDGRLKAFQFSRLKQLGTGQVTNNVSQKGQATNTWNTRYTYEDAVAVAGGITKSFHSFWQSECASIKHTLAAMDENYTGRVPLSELYGKALEKDFRFSESVEYLRDLGALDETSPRGAKVIIPNYIQSYSNCIVSAPHYLVCCQNDCEEILGEVEAAIQAPSATTRAILDVVSNMTVQTSIDDEETPKLTGELRDLLEQIAARSGGKVPLHGRLFMQWLHFVFPHECPYPHKVGTVALTSPSQYGGYVVASEEDMKGSVQNATKARVQNATKAHVRKATNQKGSANETVVEVLEVIDAEDKSDYLSQWTFEEELVVEQFAQDLLSWEQRVLVMAVGACLMTLAAARGDISFRARLKKDLELEKFFV